MDYICKIIPTVGDIIIILTFGKTIVVKMIKGLHKFEFDWF